MNKKSTYLFTILSLLLVILFIQTSYLYITKSQTKEQIDYKNSFVKLTGLPDLAILNDVKYIRHRSLSDLFSIYKEGPILREYETGTFVYSNSNLLQNTPAKIFHEK